MAGIAVASYLTAVHYRDDLLACGVGDCETVQQSRYAEVGGLPVALLGLGMFLAVALLGLIRWRRPSLAEAATMAAFAIALAGTIYSAYLTYVEFWVIDAVCQWCVASALLIVGLVTAEGLGVWRVMERDIVDD